MEGGRSSAMSHGDKTLGISSKVGMLVPKVYLFIVWVVCIKCDVKLHPAYSGPNRVLKYCMWVILRSSCSSATPTSMSFSGHVGIWTWVLVWPDSLPILLSHNKKMFLLKALFSTPLVLVPWMTKWQCPRILSESQIQGFQSPYYKLRCCLITCLAGLP